MLDMCLFNDNVKAGIIAHKDTAAQEIFRDKIAYPYSQLPSDLHTAIVTTKDNDHQIVFNNNSSLVVATSLRSGTYQWVHISEYGKICAKNPQHAAEIASGTLETVHQGNFVTIESTAEGSAGDFYDRCIEAEEVKTEGKELGKMDYKFHFYAWYQDAKNTTDPKFVHVDEKTHKYFDKVQEYIDAAGFDIELDAGKRAWYMQKKKKLKLLIYREHPSTPEEAFRAHIEGAYYGKDMAIAREAGRICTVQYDKHAPVYTIWDPGHKHTAVWFVQFIRQEIRLIDFYIDKDGIGLHEYALMLQNKGYVYGKHYAPWDVGKAEQGRPAGPNSHSMQTGRDFVDVASDVGIKFEIIEKCSIDAGIQEVQGILDRCWFDINKCDYGIRCLEMYRAKWDDSAGCYEDKPLKNWAVHGADAFRYLAIMYRIHSIKGERVGETKQAIPKKSGHSAYRPGIKRIA